MLAKMTAVLADMRVFPERMKRISTNAGSHFSPAVTAGSVEKGMPRDDAYKAVQENAMAAWEDGYQLSANGLRTIRASHILDAKALEHVFDLQRHLRYVDAIFARVFAEKPSEKSQLAKLELIRRKIPLKTEAPRMLSAAGRPFHLF